MKNKGKSQMVYFSNDVDILKYEPVLFGELHLPWQVLANGSGGNLSDTTFTESGVDFVSATVTAGCVIYLHSSDGLLDGAYEIVSVDSETQLTVSVLRSEESDDAIALPAASDITYRISTYQPQAYEAAYALTEYFGIKPGDPSSDIEAEDILDTDVLKRASVFAIISAVYAMLAGKGDNENFWKKSHYYRKCFEQARSSARVGFDFDDDGIADKTNQGGSVRLIRD
ncbi:MAG: hypothetical protein JW804_08645 [Sedimentisphaerales bacterium]|nr:hypothetical protein [Sedimentisphaerales bacterium]